MAGKAYKLPRPGLDPVAFLAGANGVGYEEGFKPPARYSHAGPVGKWQVAAPSVTNELHCNIRPRVSLAAALDAPTARRLQTVPYTPGRTPAPRIELSCGHPEEIDTQPSGAFARDLMQRANQKSPIETTTQFPGGPPANPPGLNPLPPPIPPPPIAQPPAEPTPTPTTPPVKSPPLISAEIPYFSPRVPGTLQAINFHLTGDITGGSATSELRVSGVIGAPFIIREIWTQVDSGAAPGQFLDILVSSDGDTNDSATPTGESIFPLITGLAAIPAPDRERGLAIPIDFQSLKLSYRVDSPDRCLKVLQYFVAPAAALANIHVTIIIERMDAPAMAPPPLVPRPPVLPPEGPTPAPPISQPPTPTDVPTPFYVDPNERGFTAPAWRVAAQGLARTTQNLQRGLSTQIDSYGSWLLDPNSPNAEWFRERIQKVLTSAGIENGDHNTYVSLSLTRSPYEQ